MKPNILLQQLENALPEGMQIPEELRQLYQWIENNGYYTDRDGVRYGYLYPEDKLRESWTDDERKGGTIIIFSMEPNPMRDETLECYFGNDSEEISRRLLVFCRTGADGSMGGLWVDDEGITRIVHLGSGSGSQMLCTLASNALDFLRLLAIGYDEICWDDILSLPPNSNKEELQVEPNLPFQEWVMHTFHTTIPKVGTEIVTPVDMGEEDTDDAFVLWANSVTN